MAVHSRPPAESPQPRISSVLTRPSSAPGMCVIHANGKPLRAAYAARSAMPPGARNPNGWERGHSPGPVFHRRPPPKHAKPKPRHPTESASPLSPSHSAALREIRNGEVLHPPPRRERAGVRVLPFLGGGAAHAEVTRSMSGGGSRLANPSRLPIANPALPHSAALETRAQTPPRA